MEIRKPFYSNEQHTMIDVEAKHAEYGWIPMTLTPTEYPELWSIASAMKPAINQSFIDVQVSFDTAANRASMVTSRAQLAIELRKLSVLDQRQALDAAQGNLPPALYDALKDGGLREEEDDAAIVWIGLATVPRNHDFVEALRKHLNLTPIQMDGLFS